MKLAVLFVALASAGVTSTAFAAQLQGKVTDTKGNPVKDAMVSVDGGTQTTTDAQGQYRLQVADNSHLHLHISSDNYKHGEQDLTVSSGTITQNFTLTAVQIENIVVTASPLGRSALESTTPVTVLSDDQLKLNTEPTLGDTLDKLPGVQATHFGAGASRPIIRGMDGPRVKVLENGLSVGDASTVSADHAVTAEAASAEQIEILRGPGTLLYGNGAIGGVVNVVDKRMHEQPVDTFNGSVGARYDSANNGETVNADLNGGNGKFNWHLDGTHRNTDDYDIPGEAIEGDATTHGSVDNSQLKLNEYAGGVGYTGDNGFISVSGARTESNYGIPGRGEVDAPDITIDMKKTAWQLHAGLLDPFAGFSKVRLDAGYTDYQHAEEEDGDADTFFYNKQSEARLTLNNNPWGEWQGAMGLHIMHRDFSVQGAEQLTPNSNTDTLAAFIMQERKVGDFRFELGGRVEDYRLNPEAMTLETLIGEEEYQPEKLSDLNTTLSAGLVWDFDPSYNLSLALTRAERAATAEELYSYGPHDATQSFELGSEFRIENGQIVVNAGDANKEIANNIDLTLRKLDGSWTGSLSMAYNRVNNFFYEANTGLVASDIVNSDGEGDLPVYQYAQDDAELYSIEAQAKIPFNDSWSMDLFSDYTRGKLVDGGNLPRISPLRFGSTLNFDVDQWHADVGMIAYARQTDVAENETETAGYTLVNAAVTYRLFGDSGDMLLYLKGTNLTNQEARPHTSLLKDYAPLMGRNVMLGVSYNF
ncbi:TonB-dependent receptor [Shewanella yunxiaonensis]|uniref:TonB-dependent receptor n=1 Tax=Shewanella yunxiaonensis TaxID=2829809 RepID=A0ABX7YQM5_9GAMM|nr:MULTISPECIES: TonB-dependent receptor [Shewanella]MDF0533882.1 TonB-dependent receptor [Shewanella sp. A32]QUN05064.1 TonB-dependent receptor [Shewanella yunxiaonensis]